MALTTTSIAAAFAADALAFSATSATGATVGGFVKIDDEFMVITEIAGTRISVRSRGDQGTTVRAHNTLAPCVFGLASDIPSLPAGVLIPPVFAERAVLNIGADGAIDAPVASETLYIITKATALASSTLANPSKALNGVVAIITSATAAAHVVTLTNGNDGTTGNHTTVTLAAFKGAGVSLVAVNGEWNVIGSVGATIT
jgi:hypothetical protein